MDGVYSADCYLKCYYRSNYVLNWACGGDQIYQMLEKLNKVCKSLLVHTIPFSQCSRMASIGISVV